MKSNNPNKGFLKELEAPKATEKKEAFKYSKAINTPSSQAMNTPKRLAKHSSVAEPKSNICKEFSKHVEARRKK